MSEICIFAGTSEGRKLVERLCGRGLQMTVCVATEYGEILLGEHPDVEIRAGRMDQKQMEEMEIDAMGFLNKMKDCLRLFLFFIKTFFQV